MNILRSTPILTILISTALKFNGIGLITSYLITIGQMSSEKSLLTICFNHFIVYVTMSLLHMCLRKTAFIKRQSRAAHRRKNLTRRRRRIHKILIMITSPTGKNCLYQELVDIERELQRAYKSSSEYNEQKAVEAVQLNPKYFFKYAKKNAKANLKLAISWTQTC